MAIDFDALDLVRTKNKAKRHEAIKKQRQEEIDKVIKPYMNKLSKINTEYKICADPAIQKLIFEKWMGVADLCAKKIKELKNK